MVGSDIKNSIKGWYFEQDEIKEALLLNKMLNSSIDLTNACNLNCPYCYIEEKNSIRKHRKANELTYEESLKVIDELYECGSRTITIVGAGEPTVDANFAKIVAYISEKGMTTVLFTNGILLSSKQYIVDFLFENNVSVILKYNAVGAKVQDLVAGKAGYTRNRDKALELLLSKGFNQFTPTRLGIDIMSFKGNIKEIPIIHEWCRRNNVYPIAGDYIPTGRTENGMFLGTSSALNFPKDEIDKAFDLLQPINGEDRRWLINELQSIDNRFGIQREGCYAYFGGSICTQILGLYIDIEGNIWPCIARKKKTNHNLLNGLLGNFRNGLSIKEIWEKDIYIGNVKAIYNGGCPYKPELTTHINGLVSSKSMEKL